jgi:hypothetical protein
LYFRISSISGSSSAIRTFLALLSMPVIWANLQEKPFIAEERAKPSKDLMKN